MKNKVTVVILLVAVVWGGWYLATKNKGDVAGSNVNESEEKTKMIVYKSPECGCCVGYSAAAERDGFDVDLQTIKDMQSIKDQHSIPREMESCHTSIVGDYFVEGHVPFEVIEKLLAEKPDIDGIALPDMPAGTPGMPGIKRAPYLIYQLIDGEYSEYTTL